MTDLARVTWTGDHGEQKEMHATAALAKKAATELRAAGINSVVEKVTIAKVGKKELLAALYNGDESKFAEKVELLKAVEGVKKPKDPVAAAKLKAKEVANKHRGIKPVEVAGAGSAKAGTENPSMVPKVETGDASTTTAGASTGKSSTPSGSPKPGSVNLSKGKIDKSKDAGVASQGTEVNKDVSDQAPKAENKGDLTTADLKKTGGIKL